MNFYETETLEFIRQSIATNMKSTKRATIYTINRKTKLERSSPTFNLHDRTLATFINSTFPN